MNVILKWMRSQSYGQKMFDFRFCILNPISTNHRRKLFEFLTKEPLPPRQMCIDYFLFWLLLSRNVEIENSSIQFRLHYVTTTWNILTSRYLKIINKLRVDVCCLSVCTVDHMPLFFSLYSLNGYYPYKKKTPEKNLPWPTKEEEW